MTVVPDPPRIAHDATITSPFAMPDGLETLQALVASRLDGLSPSERSLLQDSSVLGQAFTAAAAAALSGLLADETTRVLDGFPGRSGQRFRRRAKRDFRMCWSKVARQATR